MLITLREEMFSVCLEREGRRIPSSIGYHRVQHGKSPITSNKCINSGPPIPGLVCLEKGMLNHNSQFARRDLDDDDMETKLSLSAPCCPLLSHWHKRFFKFNVWMPAKIPCILQARTW